jgi:predicted nucleotidyltransferase
MKIPKKFRPALDKIKTLGKEDGYLGAFLFGSATRGELDDQSDLDVYVVVSDSCHCKDTSHPCVEGIKLDISFKSLSALEEDMLEQLKKDDRIPMICESEILFDKTGKIQNLKDRLLEQPRKKLTKNDLRTHRFLINHFHEQVIKTLRKNKDHGLVAMNVRLEDIIKRHYMLSRRHRVSPKRLMDDLNKWDKKFYKLIMNFVKENEIDKKFEYWGKMIKHLLQNAGTDKGDSVCNCKSCRKHLKVLRLVKN